MKRIRVRVTAKDIREGERCNANACPVARALERVTGAVWHVCELEALAWHPRRAEFDLSPKVREFVERFDHGLPVKPFQFTAKVRRW